MADYGFAYDDHYGIKPPAATIKEEKTASHYLRLRGLPYSAKEADIKSFFDGLGVDEVQLTQNAEGRASGEAFVGFSSVADAENGLLRDKNKIGSRYIEVFRIGEVEYGRIRNRSNVGGYGGGYPVGYSNFSKPGGTPYGGGSGTAQANILRVRGLPYACKKEELIGFFTGLTVEEVVFGKEPGDVGRPTGEAYVKFQSVEDATSAMELNGQHLGKRYLEIFRSDLDQFEHFKRQMSSTAMPLNAIQTDWPPWYSDNYEWGGYGMPVSAPVSSRGRGGGYRGRGNLTGGPYRGYDAGPPRPSPYDYHGRMYGGSDPMGGYDNVYDPYGYSMPPQYSGAPQLNYNKIYLRGLPFRVTGQQISDFFAPLNCVEIKLGYLPDGRLSGDGFVEFGTPEEAHQAKQKDRQSINNRYIEIFDNAMKASPETIYKRIGGTGRFAPSAAPVHPPSAYQW
uniref:RRM domain-containing protein n=1 Tax=Panagrolaimus superbus TaxID=310955 RepID=A0A914YUB9_9BILA